MVSQVKESSNSVSVVRRRLNWAVTTFKNAKGSCFLYWEDYRWQYCVSVQEKAVEMSLINGIKNANIGDFMEMVDVWDPHKFAEVKKEGDLTKT